MVFPSLKTSTTLRAFSTKPTSSWSEVCCWTSHCQELELGDAEGACTCSRKVQGGQASRELWQVHSGAHRRLGRWPACWTRLAPSARVAFQAVKVNQAKKSSKEAPTFHITDIGEKILGITVNPDQFKKRTYFPDDPIEFKAYVKGHIQASMLVRCCETFSYTQSGYSNGTTFIAKVGDFGRTISPQFSTVQVKWENRITCSPKDCFVNLELLTGPLHTTLLSSS